MTENELTIGHMSDLHLGRKTPNDPIGANRLNTLRKAIHDLSEAFLKYLAATPEAESRARQEAEAALAKAGKTLEELVDADQITVRKLEESRVVSMDSSIGLIVLDSGRQGGVRVGTPVTIERNEVPIYTALIVEVRDSISGALLQEKIGTPALLGFFFFFL